MIKLKELRKAKNLSQEQVCKELYLDQSTYHRYEVGTSKPSFETLKKLATFFNVSIDYLLEYNQEELKVSFNHEEVNELIKVINMLNSKIKSPLIKDFSCYIYGARD